MKDIWQGIASMALNTIPPKGIVELSDQQAYGIAGYGLEDMQVVRIYYRVAPRELCNIGKRVFAKFERQLIILKKVIMILTGTSQ